MRRVTCLQHVPFEGPGCLASAFTAGGWAVDPVLVPRDGVPEQEADILLVMGGPMSVNDSDPWIAAETAFIRHHLASGRPYLGICLGSQFLAKAAGGRVAPGPCVEIGPTPIHTLPGAAQDPLFRAFPDRLDVIEWHDEGIHLADDAIPLAASAAFPVQAFRAGRAAYGLLFHLELEEAGLQALCRECPSDLRRAGTSADSLLRAARPHLAGLQAHAQQLVQRLVELAI